MAGKKIYPKGLFFNKPNDNAPDFVIGKVSVKCADFVAWMRENHEKMAASGYMYFDVLKGQENKPYVALNTFEPKKQDDGGGSKEPEQDNMPF